ncbi:MAG: alpha/beta hydrolase, partial [Anaerolineae bacterium]|nr:alpha/beta hydrolase [Anaerolineae bacterium]
MRARFFVWLLVVIFVIPAVAPAALAQESDPLTCDEGPNDALNAAQAARDAGELAQALELAVQAEALCADSVIRYTQALTLRTEIERLIEQQEREEFRAAVMPGLVDLGDYALFMRCEGAGSPTIIFENGFDNSLDTWDPVREQAAAMTRTCVYDHLGVGYSDVVADIRQRTTQDQVDDLHQLLALAGIAPP